MNIMQGDAYPVGFDIVDLNGAKITPAAVSEIEIVLNGVRKTYTAGEVYFDDRWYFPLTQEETFAMPEVGKCHVRVKSGDVVIGEYVEPVYMIEGQSIEVL